MTLSNLWWVSAVVSGLAIMAILLSLCMRFIGDDLINRLVAQATTTSTELL